MQHVFINLKVCTLSKNNYYKNINKHIKIEYKYYNYFYNTFICYGKSLKNIIKVM